MSVKPKILLISGYPERYKDAFLKHLKEIDIIYTKRSSEVPINAAEVDILLAWVVSRDLLREMTSLKWIHCTGAGVDSFFKESDLLRGKILTRTIGNLPELMAQYVTGVILTDNIGIHVHAKNQAMKKWDWAPYRDVRKRTALVIGTGKIGSKVGKSLKYWNMTVIGMNRTGKHAEGFDCVYRISDWREAIPSADYIVLVLPLTEESRGLIDLEKLEMMNKDAELINIARGAIVKEEDLVKALREGWIRRAILDVFEKEPLPNDSPLWELPEVTITPHIAGVSDPDLVAAEFAENYKRYINGESLMNVVDIEKGY